MELLNVTWADFGNLCQHLANVNRRSCEIGVYGIPTGGCFVAHQLAREGDYFKLLDQPEPGCLVVDDIIDSGKTVEGYRDFQRAALYRKSTSPSDVPALHTVDAATWIKMPWEAAHAPEDAVIRLLEWIGEDPKRNGLKDTPGRVLRALKEMTAGYQERPEQILARVFEEAYDEVIIVRNVPFTSLCEHHILPFVGTVDLGYIPGKGEMLGTSKGGGVVGLSKLARLVDCFSRRLQVQERMTKQIAEAIQTYLQAAGVMVVVRASHSCMACRGVKKPGADMVTSVCLGVFRDKPEARAEFLELVRGAGH